MIVNQKYTPISSDASTTVNPTSIINEIIRMREDGRIIRDHHKHCDPTPPIKSPPKPNRISPIRQPLPLPVAKAHGHATSAHATFGHGRAPSEMAAFILPGRCMPNQAIQDGHLQSSGADMRHQAIQDGRPQSSGEMHAPSGHPRWPPPIFRGDACAISQPRWPPPVFRGGHAPSGHPRWPLPVFRGDACAIRPSKMAASTLPGNAHAPSRHPRWPPPVFRETDMRNQAIQDGRLQSSGGRTCAIRPSKMAASSLLGETHMRNQSIFRDLPERHGVTRRFGATYTIFPYFTVPVHFRFRSTSGHACAVGPSKMAASIQLPMTSLPVPVHFRSVAMGYQPPPQSTTTK